MKDNWKAQRSSYNGGNTFIVAQGDKTIADNIKTKETALLMASAPELLDALEDITPTMPPIDAGCHKGICSQAKCGHCGRIANARAAIEKAKGNA